MLTLQIIGSVGGAAIALIQLAGLFVQNRMRADIAELKVQLAESRATDKAELREWVEEEFARKDTMEAKFDALKARIAQHGPRPAVVQE